MNNARIWLAVKPTLGVPLFFAGVAVTSLLIHAAVLTHTTWYPAFYQGGQRVKMSQTEPASQAPDLAQSSAHSVAVALK
jgi:light-harvesting protein B-800-850 alpha chain